MVTYSELYAFGMLIVAIITLVYTISQNKKK